MEKEQTALRLLFQPPLPSLLPPGVNHSVHVCSSGCDETDGGIVLTALVSADADELAASDDDDDVVPAADADTAVDVSLVD